MIPISYSWQGFLDEVSRMLRDVSAGDDDLAVELDLAAARSMLRANRLGQVLTEEGDISPTQLEAALHVSDETGQQLGNVLVNEGLISPKRLAAALRSQRERNRLGRLLVQVGLITESQLQEALKIQASTGRKLGTVLITSGFCSREKIIAFLRAKRDHYLIGQMLVSAGHVTESQVAEALKEQANTSQLLGNILINQGVVQSHQVRAALKRQSYQNRIGGILLRLGYLTDAQLEHALILQHETGQLLGQIVVKHGYCTTGQVNQALQIRRDLLRLGRRLVRAKVISATQLEEALAIQEETGHKLSEILVRLNYVSENRLNHFLNVGQPSVGESIGSRLVREKRITRLQLKKALDDAAASGKSLEDSLVSLGFVTAQDLKPPQTPDQSVSRRVFDSLL